MLFSGKFTSLSHRSNAVTDRRGLEKTGGLSAASGILGFVLGPNIFLGSLLLLLLVGVLSSLIPNIPLVVAMVPLLKEYVVAAGLTSADILAPNFTGDLPAELLPLFYAMMYGAPLGGNGTLVGASSNIVAAGIAEQHGQRISFHIFLRYGIPLTALQLSLVGLYVGIRFLEASPSRGFIMGVPLKQKSKIWVI